MTFYRPPTTQGTLDALAAFYRALRAYGFYPQGHPTRRTSISHAHKMMQDLLDNNTLSLSAGRTGFSFPDGEFIKDTSGISAALAYELFIRRVQKITFFNDLFLEDLLELCKILCLSPDHIQSIGGIDKIMAERGIRSIWVNEFDLTIIGQMRQKVEQSGVRPHGIDETENGNGDVDASIIDEEEAEIAAPDLELQIQKLLERLATCVDDDIYLILARQVVSSVDMLQSRHLPHLFFPLIELFVSHANDPGHSKNMRECAQFAIEQILTNGELFNWIFEQVEMDSTVSHTTLHAILKAGGANAIIAAILLMGRTSNLKVRKTIYSTVESLGEIALPTLLTLMDDNRWFITRNICSLLGSICNSEALPHLMSCLRHNDQRVRKEAIRSLALIGGQDAELAIISILRSSDKALFPQAILSLGGMKSRKSLPELLKILFLRDVFLEAVPLKLDVLAAIALIGDRQVTPHLLSLLQKRYLFAPKRAKRLKSAIAICLGKLGDPKAIPILKNIAAEGGELGAICSEAVIIIEKRK